MDIQAAFNILLGLFVGLGAWLLKTLWTAVEKLKEDIRQLEIKLPTEYVAKSDLNQLRDEIMQRFDKLDAKLDSKADR